MNIRFQIDDATTAEFKRNNLTGATSLTIGNETTKLDSPLNPRTHFEISTERTWQLRSRDHDVEITKHRKRLFGGFREAEFVVKVNGEIVAEVKGT